MAGHEIKECKIAEDGVCALHGIEVERRKQTAQMVENIPGILTNMNRIIGYSVLVSLIIVGGFVYIRDVKQAVDYSHEMHKSDMALVTAQISTLTTTAARSEEKYVAMLRELENLNGQIRVLISSNTGNQRQNVSK
jgi:hypothetical protein